MAGLNDFYLQQIAAARQQYPMIAQRPVNAGIRTGSSSPGWGDTTQAIGATLGDTFIKPRLEAIKKDYIMNNDPQVLEQQMVQGYDIYNKMPDELKETVRQTQGHQELLNKYAQKVPNADRFISKAPDGTLMFAPRAKTLEEAQAIEVAPNAASERVLKQSMTDENLAKVPYWQAMTESAKAEVPLKGAQTTYYGAESNRANAEAEKAKTETQWLPTRNRAAVTKDYAEAGYYNRMPAKTDLSAFRMELEKQGQEKNLQILKGHQATMKLLRDDFSQKVGSKPSLSQNIEYANRTTNEVLNYTNSVGPRDPVAGAEASTAIDSLYGGFVGTSASNKSWAKIAKERIPFVSNTARVTDYTADQLKQMKDIQSKATEVFNQLGPCLTKEAIQKWIWMEMVLDPQLSAQRTRFKTYKDIPDSVVRDTVMKHPLTQQILQEQQAQPAQQSVSITRRTSGGR